MHGVAGLLMLRSLLLDPWDSFQTVQDSLMVSRLQSHLMLSYCTTLEGVLDYFHLKMRGYGQLRKQVELHHSFL